MSMTIHGTRSPGTESCWLADLPVDGASGAIHALPSHTIYSTAHIRDPRLPQTGTHSYRKASQALLYIIGSSCVVSSGCRLQWYPPVLLKIQNFKLVVLKTHHAYESTSACTCAAVPVS